MPDPVALAAAVVDTPPTNVVDNINVYQREDYNDWFEEAYSSTAEPWEYSHRAGELYRHQYTIREIQKLNAAPEKLLELGSSKGLMTEKLMTFCKNLYASDISLTAMKACKRRCEEQAATTKCNTEYYVTTTPGLPFAEETFDVVTVCDGFVGWWFSDEKKMLALQDIQRVLKKGGYAIMTDFIQTEGNIAKFDAYEKLIRQGALPVVEVKYLHDRPWYFMESVLNKLRLKKVLSPLMSSIPVAKGLTNMGKLFGRKMSNHIIIILRKD